MEKPIRLFLLTGFLGAGKTTLLKQVLEQRGTRRIGVIMNEFGKIGVDGPVIRRHGIEILEINNGSIFCSCLKGAFIEGLAAYSTLPVDDLFVETSGMADPSSIETILHNFVGRVKGQPYDYRGTVCIIDACRFLGQVELLVAIEKQVAASSLILVNKSELVDEATLLEVEAEVKRINSRAALRRTSFGRIDSALLDALEPLQKAAGEAESCNTPANRPMEYLLSTDGTFSFPEVRAFLEAVSPLTLRIKGFFRMEGGWCQIDAVDKAICMVPANLERETSELVLISEPDESLLATVRREWAGRFTQTMTVR